VRRRPVGDVFDDPEVQAWARRAAAELVPMLRDSAATVSIVPAGETDVKFAVELGFSIMLGKPIILAVTPGMQVPDKLLAVADAVVEIGEHPTPDDARRIQAAVERVVPEES
jgi:hypothetical protein